MNGVVVWNGSADLVEQVKQHGYAVIERDQPCVPWDKTLILSPGINIPWGLLVAGWHFLDRWDVAVPLWFFGKTAGMVGTQQERQRTKEIVRDLRVPLYSHELLFVRKNEIGQTLIETWIDEMRSSNEQRLAFLRAYYRLKPKLCALPAAWVLAETTEKVPQRKPTMGLLQARRERQAAALLRKE